MPKNLGFTFIEILISLFLLSLILLGMDAMQLTALRAAKSSYYFSVASQQMSNMINRLTVLQGADATKQITIWNKQNEKLLPQGFGEINGSYPNYSISINWGKKTEEPCHTNKIGQSGCIRLLVSL